MLVLCSGPGLFGVLVVQRSSRISRSGRTVVPLGCAQEVVFEYLLELVGAAFGVQPARQNCRLVSFTRGLPCGEYSTS